MNREEYRIERPDAYGWYKIVRIADGAEGFFCYDTAAENSCILSGASTLGLTWREAAHLVNASIDTHLLTRQKGEA